MARIYKDRIECDKSDPIIRIRSPSLVKYWAERAAVTRGMTLEELINELLFDRFHMIKGPDGKFKQHNHLERVERRHLVTQRMALTNTKKRDLKLRDMAQKQIKADVALVCARYKAKKKGAPLPGIDWEAFRKLRQDNIRRLLEDELQLSQHLLPTVREGKSPQELADEAEKHLIWNQKGSTGGRKHIARGSKKGKVEQVHRLDTILPEYIDDGSQVPTDEPEIVDPIAAALKRQ